MEEVDALERLCEWMAMSILYTCICMRMLIVPLYRLPSQSNNPVFSLFLSACLYLYCSRSSSSEVYLICRSNVPSWDLDACTSSPIIIQPESRAVSVALQYPPHVSFTYFLLVKVFHCLS